MKRKREAGTINSDASTSGTNNPDGNDNRIPDKLVGLRKTHHGTHYQIIILMLFAWKALNNKYKFRLCTEEENGGKFDDLVLQFTKSNDQTNICWLIQIKHAANSDTITLHDLENDTNKEFNLNVYIKSYLDQIIPSKGIKPSRFIFWTNRKLDENLTNKMDQEELSKIDNLLHPEEVKYWKFKSYYITYDLLTKFVTNYSNDKCDTYHKCIVNVINKKKKKNNEQLKKIMEIIDTIIKNEFIEGNNCEEYQELRKEFIEIYYQKCADTGECQIEEKFKEYLRKLQEIIVVVDAIDSFLNNLIFVDDYSSEMVLKSIKNDQLSEHENKVFRQLFHGEIENLLLPSYSNCVSQIDVEKMVDDIQNSISKINEHVSPKRK